MEMSDEEAKLEAIRNGIIGADQTFVGPFGERKLVYCDWTASGRAFEPIETAIREKVLPFYGNTHTFSSITGMQSTWFREEARQIIEQAVNANSKTDCVIFTGSGATGAINKIVSALGLYTHKISNEENRPVVFIGPYEHHSNILTWRESCAHVVNIPADENGNIDVQTLELELIKYRSRPLRIGSFSAASNVTGIISDIDKITATLHKNGALAFWDYAAAGPYLRIDMNPVLDAENPDRALVSKDAIFLSPHKFLGGVNTPGILLVKKCLLNNKVPARPSIGGGTVFFVTSKSHRYFSNRIHREEGGTPDIVGSIRAGLSFKIKQAIGPKTIESLECKIFHRIATRLHSHGNIVLLGPKYNNEAPLKQLPIFSFLIKYDSARYLHYNFVCALLNDLYGIQTRGGCMCAGPYTQGLLGMTEELVKDFEDQLASDPKHKEFLRPGFTRFTLPYFTAEEEIDFVVEAIENVAEFGWRMLPLYRFSQKTGEWKHISRVSKEPGRIWLNDFSLFSSQHQNSTVPKSCHFRKILRDSLRIMQFSDASNLSCATDQMNLLDESSLRLLWFVLPSEVQSRLYHGQDHILSVTREARLTPLPVFDPINFWKSLQPEYNSSAVSVKEKERVFSELGDRPSIRDKQVDSSCKNGSCVKKRKRDKYPVRNISTIRQEQTISSIQGMWVKNLNARLHRPKPPSKIMRLVGRAIKEWSMIEHGDKLLLGLSGGKDSLALLHILLALQKRAPVDFEIGACTIDPQTEAYDPSPLIPYVDSLNIKYHYIKTPIFDSAKKGSLQGTSICSYCARMKRGALYECARKNGYTTLVLAQHLDDFAETMLMSIFHNGQLRSMKASYLEKQGDVKVIRPVCYVRERDLRDFSYSAALPIINENCPACFEAPQERRRIKKLLAEEEALSPNVFDHMRRALIPLMDEFMLASINGFIQEVQLRSSKRK